MQHVNCSKSRLRLAGGRGEEDNAIGGLIQLDLVQCGTITAVSLNAENQCYSTARKLRR